MYAKILFLRALPVLLAGYLSSLAIPVAQAADFAVGSPAPELEFKILDTAEAIRLSQNKGKVFIVNLWATWCAPCKAEMPLLQAYYQQHHQEGLEVIAVSMDDPRDVMAVRRVAQSFSFPVALKSDANLKAWGRIWRMPTTFVVDREGILRKNGHVGPAELTAAELEAVVSPLLAR